MFLTISFLVYLVGAAAIAVVPVLNSGDPRFVSGAVALSLVQTATSVGPFLIFMVIAHRALKLKL